MTGHIRRNRACVIHLHLLPLSSFLYKVASDLIDTYFHTMRLVLLFFTLAACVAVANALAISNDHDQPCDARVDSFAACTATVSFPGGCSSSTANLTNTDYARCKTISFFWSYPQNNLTLIIETPFTSTRQPYTVYFDNEQLMSGVLHVYRLFNNQETEVTTRDKKLIQYSDSNYQIILKLQGPSRLSRYGVNVDYEVVKM